MNATDCEREKQLAGGPCCYRGVRRQVGSRIGAIGIHIHTLGLHIPVLSCLLTVTMLVSYHPVGEQ